VSFLSPHTAIQDTCKQVGSSPCTLSCSTRLQRQEAPNPGPPGPHATWTQGPPGPHATRTRSPPGPPLSGSPVHSWPCFCTPSVHPPVDGPRRTSSQWCPSGRRPPQLIETHRPYACTLSSPLLQQCHTPCVCKGSWAKQRLYADMMQKIKRPLLQQQHTQCSMCCCREAV
jgi:hypothetical protein